MFQLRSCRAVAGGEKLHAEISLPRSRFFFIVGA
jgi:hypothetical protein